MAGLTIGKLGFGKDDFFYGLELCLHKAGREAYSVTELTASAVDVLLVTVFWYLDAYMLEAFLRRAGIPKQAKHRPIIIVGGMQATMTPMVFAALVDYVFVGDADDHLGPILDAIERGERPESPYLVTETTETMPVPAECAPVGFAINKGGARGTWRIEIARGCRFKCSFCALSGLKPYQEVSIQDIEATLQTIPRGAPVVLFAPERMEHSQWSDIERIVYGRGLHDMGSDVRLENLPKCGKAAAHIGIEGPSERLRRSIKKGFSDDLILAKVGEWIHSLGRLGMLTMYFVADLPGETEKDLAALRVLFERIEAEQWSRKLTLKPVLNPLSPKPFTPLAKAVIHPFRDYSEMWRRLLRNGDTGQWGFRVVETMVWGPYERIRDVIVERGGLNAGQLIKATADKRLCAKPPTSERKAAAVMWLRAAHDVGLTDERLGIDCDAS